MGWCSPGTRREFSRLWWVRIWRKLIAVRTDANKACFPAEICWRHSCLGCFLVQSEQQLSAYFFSFSNIKFGISSVNKKHIFPPHKLLNDYTLSCTPIYTSCNIQLASPHHGDQKHRSTLHFPAITTRRQRCGVGAGDAVGVGCPTFRAAPGTSACSRPPGRRRPSPEEPPPRWGSTGP